jgi:hypothetical protein
MQRHLLRITDKWSYCHVDSIAASAAAAAAAVFAALPCSTEPSFSLQLGTLGTFKLSASLVLQLQQIFMLPGVSWKYETLYVPCLLPFVVAGLVTVWLYWAEMQQQQLPCYAIFTHAWRKMKGEQTVGLLCESFVHFCCYRVFVSLLMLRGPFWCILEIRGALRALPAAFCGGGTGDSVAVPGRDAAAAAAVLCHLHTCLTQDER